MLHRYRQAVALFPSLKVRPFAALREKWKEGYTFSDFRSDLMSGIIVGMVAIPLGMALAIASGVAPQYGLYTVVVAGAVVALLGGSRFQVTGPTAAFVVILAPITERFGLRGLLVAGLMAGVMLVLMGLARMGTLIQFIPYPVTTGFTSGIAVVIATLQLKDFFGLRVTKMPERFLEKVMALVEARGSASLTEFLIGAFTLTFLILWPKFIKRVPAPLVALSSVTVATVVLKNLFPDLEISTIGTRFTYELNGIMGHGIPQAAPHFEFPWNLPGIDTKPFSWEVFQALIPPAFAITMLGGIESLLSAVVADGMAQTQHDPDAELIAVGVGNILCPFFGGIAATGAIARTATNIRFGAKSPLSAVIHAAFTLLVVLLFAPYVSYLPMAALAALLLLVAYNMSETKHFFHIVKVAPRSDVIVLLSCFGLTVLFDMVVGVTIGIVLAALLFMQRMAAVTSVQGVATEKHAHIKQAIPKEVLIYEIAGPLFFGAAQNAMEALSEVSDGIRVVIFYMENVPIMDVTGLVAFESAIERIIAKKRQIYLVGVKEQPTILLKKSRLFQNLKENSKGSSEAVHLCATLNQALEKAKDQLTTDCLV